MLQATTVTSPANVLPTGHAGTLGPKLQMFVEVAFKLSKRSIYQTHLRAEYIVPIRHIGQKLLFFSIYLSLSLG